MLTPLSKRKTILLIEDDEDDCYLFMKALTKLNSGLALHSTHSADNLYEVLESAKPSIIFIDLHLPKINGLEYLRIIRSHSGFEQIPIVFWSGSYHVNNITAAYDAGAQYYFEKPSCIIDLVSELKKVLTSYTALVNPEMELLPIG